jgi:hypothetical protein
MNVQSSVFDIKGGLIPAFNEKCIRVCAALAEDYCGQGRRVRFMSNSGDNDKTVDCTASELYDILLELAFLRNNAVVDFDTYLKYIVPGIKNSEIIIVSPFCTEYCDVIGSEYPWVSFVFPDMIGDEQ